MIKAKHQPFTWSHRLSFFFKLLIEELELDLTGHQTPMPFSFYIMLISGLTCSQSRSWPVPSLLLVIVKTVTPHFCYFQIIAGATKIKLFRNITMRSYCIDLKRNSSYVFANVLPIIKLPIGQADPNSFYNKTSSRADVLYCS